MNKWKTGIWPEPVVSACGVCWSGRAVDAHQEGGKDGYGQNYEDDKRPGVGEAECGPCHFKVNVIPGEFANEFVSPDGLAAPGPVPYRIAQHECAKNCHGNRGARRDVGIIPDYRCQCQHHCGHRHGRALEKAV